jgi:hypothetical protein
MARVIWKPQPKQAIFLSRPENEVFYGGAAGGGKSDAIIVRPLRQVHIPHFRAIIFRKTFPEASQLIDRSIELYKKAFPRAKYNDNKHVWTFPSGAKVSFGSMQHKKDRIKHQGKYYDEINFDEVTHFTWDEYSYMFSRNRPGGPGTSVSIGATGNPGGRGHGWVKQRFIDSMKPYQRYIAKIKVQGKTYIKSRIFIPATVFDNKILLANDPNYIASLGQLPEAERKALLFGDWNTFQGQVFLEWRDDPTHYQDRLWTHVISPFQIPREWKRFCTLDWGYSRPFSVAWWAMDYDGRLYRERELYGCTSVPDRGVRWTPGQVAEKIKEIEEKYYPGIHFQRIADPAIFQRTTGESIAWTFENHQIYWEPGDNQRIPGKMQFHYRLAFDDEGRPMFYSFSWNRGFNRTIPALVYSDTDVEDVDTKTEDHQYDEARYLFMENPIPAPKAIGIEEQPYNPLDDEPVVDRYAFMRA